MKNINNVLFRISLIFMVPILLFILMWVGFRATAVRAAPDNTITVTNTNDSGAGSLRRAIADANPGDTIQFDAGLSNSTIILSSELVIDKDLTIEGSVPITISGNDATRVFNVTGGRVTFDSLTIANGRAQNDCYVVDWFGCGGGIKISSSSVALTITNNILTGNVSSRVGGGVYNEGGMLTVNNSTLSGNSVSLDGGGIYNREGTMTVYSSIFVNNTAADDGGGVFNYNGMMTVDGSVLTDNSADNGGGIYSYGGTIISVGSAALTVNDSTLSGNSAGLGGGIYNRYGTAEVSRSTLANNSVNNNGGGLYNYEAVLIVTGSTLTDNSANNNGGGIADSGGGVTVNDSTLSGNSANNRAGGGIYNPSGAVTVTNSTLSGNSAGGNGGGVFGTATVSNSTLISNTANYGGGVFVPSSRTMTMNNTTLTANSADSDGGGICSYGDSTTTTALTNTIVSANVLNGTATADDLSLYTGAIDSFVSGGHNLIGSLGTDVHAFTDGVNGDQVGVTDPQLGPLADNGGNTFTLALLSDSPAIDAGDCTNGPAYDQRGVPRPQDETCDIGAYELACTRTVVNTDAGGLGSLRHAIKSVCDGGLITFEPGLSGSVIDIAPEGELTIDHSLIISGNVPITISGGNASRVFNVMTGMLATDVAVTFDSLTIANGHVQTDNCGPFALKCGGGIMVQNAGVAVTITNSALISNTADYGGGIATFDGRIMVSRSTLAGNSASLGGGVYDYYGTVAVENSTISGNSAATGGGICNYAAGTVTVSSSTISGNSASVGGGGISSDGSIVTAGDATTKLTNSIVAGNVKGATANDLRLVNGTIDSYESGGHNLIGSAGANIIAFTDGINDDQVGVTNPQLGPLADNGGDTFTLALLSGSPAVDAGDCTTGPATDQRGVARPQDGACDVGAYEARVYTLTVSTTGAGGGIVSGAGVTCGADCMESVVEGTAITLTATAETGSTFTGWSGACSGAEECVVTLEADKLVTATFALNQQTLTVSHAGAGSGTISSDPDGIACPGDCTETFTYGTVVTLTATAETGSTFTGWSGACSGAEECVVTLEADKLVTATFAEIAYPVFLPLIVR